MRCVGWRRGCPPHGNDLSADIFHAINTHAYELYHNLFSRNKISDTDTIIYDDYFEF